jgi:hypothetical protein
VPQFLLRRWTNTAGKLHVFSRRNGRLVSTERAPRSTGFVDGLYAIVAGAFGLSADHIERKLFGTIDNNAAVALGKLESHEAFTPDEQIAWTFFLSSLRIRQPDTLHFLRSAAIDYVKRTLAAKDKVTLPAGEPSTVQWFEQNFPGGLEAKSLTSWLPRMITHDGVLDAFESLLWFTREFTADAPKLLLSDMPLHWDTGLNDPNLLIQLPLGPNRVFFGARTEECKQIINQMSVPELVRRINRTSLASSAEYIWASDKDEARAFIEDNLDILGVHVVTFAQISPWGAQAGTTDPASI